VYVYVRVCRSGCECDHMYISADLMVSHTQMYANKHTRTHTYTNTHTHTQTRTHAHIHKHRLWWLTWGFPAHPLPATLPAAARKPFLCQPLIRYVTHTHTRTRTRTRTHARNISQPHTHTHTQTQTHTKPNTHTIYIGLAKIIHTYVYTVYKRHFNREFTIHTVYINGSG